MSIEANKALGRRFFAEQDRLKGGPAADLCAPGYTVTIAGNPPMDRAGHEQFAKGFYRGFPDITHTVLDTVAEPDRVAVRFVLRGTQTGEFMGIPATGKPVEIPAIAMLQIADGRVVELIGLFDQLGMMRQLGLLP